MKKMVFIFGPPAAGKMTVGKELTKLTNYALLHNHVTIEFLLPFFDFHSKEFRRLDELIRKELISSMRSSEKPGMIFSFVWEIDSKEELDYVNGLWQQYTDDISNVCFVELSCPQEVRVERNKCASRIKAKPSKADLVWSENNLKEMDKNYILNTSSDHPFPYPDRHLQIDNSSLEAETVANKIREYFDL